MERHDWGGKCESVNPDQHPRAMSLLALYRYALEKNPNFYRRRKCHRRK